PRMRAVMSRIPMFTVMTEKESLAQAKPLAKALMFAAGETATIVCLVLTGLYAWAIQLPGGVIWFIIAVLMSLSAVTAPAKMPKGDYAKAIKALRGK
ncbi:MAG TPA: hypothetical protein VHO69_10955, partial [Phototrophicaceae bacterium]|nr:hypothetical protein [Phototrophicaceae bacterium]